jgi:transcriptional regulator with XRE-family HTH domain
MVIEMTKFTPQLTPIDPPPQLDLMLSEEFLALLDELGLSQGAAARLLGVTNRTVNRWANGSYPFLPPAARFLRYLARKKISPISVMETLA